VLLFPRPFQSLSLPFSFKAKMWGGCEGGITPSCRGRNLISSVWMGGSDWHG
jgi:hypothetical protein